MADDVDLIRGASHATAVRLTLVEDSQVYYTLTRDDGAKIDIWIKTVDGAWMVFVRDAARDCDALLGPPGRTLAAALEFAQWEKIGILRR
jgi:hypothetical protein